MDNLKQLVAESLSTEDQALWEKVFTALDGEEAFGLVEFIGNDIEKLKFWTNNLRQKMEALTSLDRAAIEQILQAEKDLIENNHE